MYDTARDRHITSENGKLLGKVWEELDEAERRPYIDQAARDKYMYENRQNTMTQQHDDPADQMERRTVIAAYCRQRSQEEGYK